MDANDDENAMPMPVATTHDDNKLLTPAAVAAMFAVNPKTVSRWARAGLVASIRTPGGHRRYRASDLRRFLEDDADRY